jgi:glycosyltransferase involved in cell wall biosynthesis
LYERLVENRNLGHAAGLIYTAQGEMEAAGFLNLSPPAYVVPLGLDAASFDRAGGFRARYGLADKELILWMGRLAPVKGLDLLIRAFAGLARRRPKAVLVLVGPDTENLGQGLRQLLVELGMDPKRAIFTGMLHGNEKRAALSEADLFVMPSHTENFALAAVEAMALGRPVIVSNGVKIAPEIAKAGAGIVVSLQGAELEIALADLLEDVQRRLRMGEAALALARQYGWPVIVGRLEEAYRAMMA